MFILDKNIKISTKDLKTIRLYKSGLVVSGRDNNIQIIHSDENIVTLSPEISHINSLAVAGSTIIAGGQSGLIAIYDGFLEDPKLLPGHENNVSSLCEKNDILISGSWDHTVRLWNLKNMTEILRLEMPDCVWCVRFVEGVDNFLPLDFIVGTADGYISVYKNNIQWTTYKIHLSAVRSLRFNNGYLFSIGNDGKLMKSTVGGRLMNVYDFKEFMYSLHVDRSILVTGEKGMVNVMDFNLDLLWSESVNAQSCWDGIIVDENIFLAGSDGILYSLNINAERKESKVKETNNNDAKLMDPNYKVIDGKVYFSENGEWNLIGDVIEDKKDFDHTFTVEVDNRNLTIQFNTDDNVYDVANKFLETNNLPSSYQNDIVNFINQNFKPKTSFFIYRNINIEGIKKFLNDEFIIENLKNPDISNNKEISEKLFVLLNMEDENFYVLDCYRFFHSRGFEFDFSFLQDYPVENKKNATVFLRLVCNLLSNLPFAIEVLEDKIKTIIDLRLVDEGTIEKYKMNSELLK